MPGAGIQAAEITRHKIDPMTTTTPPPLQITLTDGTLRSFTSEFTIGRNADCDISIQDHVVSRNHADVSWDGSQWWIEDRQSANGVFIDDQRIRRAALFGAGRIQLGSGGPTLHFLVIKPEDAPPVDPPTESPPQFDTVTTTPSAEGEQPSLDHVKDHYFGKMPDQEVGEHTIMVRRAFAEVQKKQRMTFGIIIGVVVLLLIVTGGVAWYKHAQVVEQRRLAVDVFYGMRALEMELVQLRATAAELKSKIVEKQVETVKAQQQKLEQSYDRYMTSLNVYGKGLSEKEKLIMRMAHRFGECEINMPDGFVQTVDAYIANWQSRKRLTRVIQRASRQGYIAKIVNVLTNEGLPGQFFYLAVQESNLNLRAVGPPTRFGIAKGMWQFIPSTAEKYGLRTGPLKDEAVVDPLDDRHDFTKSTRAAARYLRDIYTTDAQASGLLVMASYNWGERRVVKRIQALPANPQERNFWKLITAYREDIPDETYDYVFSIFSAAVIGENPRLFGFDFDNPLSLAN